MRISRPFSLTLVTILAITFLGGPIVRAEALEAAAADARAVAEAAGLAAWEQVERIHFAWHLLPKDLRRTYDWDVRAGHVTVSSSAGTITIPTAAVPADDAAAVAAHQAFVNDSYWLLFPLHLAWDDVMTLVATSVVPGFPDLGERPALDVRYPTTGGYTPGDRYVLYLGDDHLPVAWALHTGGADEPTLVTRWDGYAEHGGLRLATRFSTSDGKPFIVMEELRIETRAP
jgi:hypothetical protein